MPMDNIWQWFLEDYPDTAFASLSPQGMTPFANFWQGQKGRVRNEYEGALGRMALSGQQPALEYTDWLQHYPWMRKWLQMSPGQRGERNQFSSVLRYNT